MSGPRTHQDTGPDSLRDRSRELATLLEVSRALASTLQLEDVLQAATDGVTRLHALKTAAVYLERATSCACPRPRHHSRHSFPTTCASSPWATTPT
jgi:K+-sensing histidine kinase KdpD